MTTIVHVRGDGDLTSKNPSSWWRQKRLKLPKQALQKNFLVEYDTESEYKLDAPTRWLMPIIKYFRQPRPTLRVGLRNLQLHNIWESFQDSWIAQNSSKHSKSPTSYSS